MKTLYFCGAGNSEGLRLAYNINEKADRWDRMFVLDDDASRHGTTLLGCEIIGGFARLAEADPQTSEVVNLVARTTGGRRAARRKIASYGVPFASLVSPDVDTFGAEVAHDAIVYPNATIGPESVVGEGSVVFMGAVVGHEARVGAGCVLAANSVLNARVELSEGVYVGTNATVLPEVRVGAGATIGAGSVAFEDVPDHTTAIGVPAEFLMGAPADTNGAPGAVAAVEIDHELEQTLCKIWQEILEIPRVDVSQNFFDAGGNSLLAVRMRDHVRKVTGREISLVDLFQFPTVRSLAARLGGEATERRREQPGRTRAEVRRELRTRRQTRR